MEFDVGSSGGGRTRVVFPYPRIYPEQYHYMSALRQALDANFGSGPALLEMPSGTGKTASLLSVILAFLGESEGRRLLYCSRTIPEIDQTVEELRRVLAARSARGGEQKTFAMAMGSRRHLCVHEEVSANRVSKEVDSLCRNLTAPWVRSRKRTFGDVEDALPTCKYYEELERRGGSVQIEGGVYSLGDWRAFGRAQGVCPYFAARSMLPRASVVVWSYQYVLDPKVSGMLMPTLGSCRDTVLVFDEAHNIDNVCLEALSVTLDTELVEQASANAKKLKAEVEKVKAIDGERLRREYDSLVKGLALAGAVDPVLVESVLPDRAVKEAVPGNMRRSEHFVGWLIRLTEYLKVRLKAGGGVVVEGPGGSSAEEETPVSFLYKLSQATAIDANQMKCAPARLGCLLATLEMPNTSSLAPICQVAYFAALAATYTESGFRLVTEPVPGRQDQRLLQFCCLDASVAFAPLVNTYGHIVITSGTLSPLDIYPKMLGFKPCLSERFTMSLARPCVLPLIVTRGSDQVVLTSRYEARGDPGVVRNYGNLLSELCRIVPDGLVGFFPSYHYLEQAVSAWNDMGMLGGIVSSKLLFIETSDPVETSIALTNYKAACDSGRGAVLLAVARGKLSEGIDFTDHYGRCVIVFGIPYLYTQSMVLRARMEHLYETCGIKEGDFLTFDAMRTASQCVGRAIRGKSDYAVLVFADKRYSRMDKRTKLPQWLLQFVDPYPSRLNMSTETCCSLTRDFMRHMAQPFSVEDQIGKALWGVTEINASQKDSNASLLPPTLPEAMS